MADVISSELKAILKRLKLSPIRDTLYERATLARQQHMAHLDFWSWCSPTRSPGAIA